MESISSFEWAIKPFDDGGEARQLRTEWEEWLEAFEFEAATKRNFTQAEMFNLLMAKGGRVLQRIFKNKEPVAEEVTDIIPPRAQVPVYDNAVSRLSDYFVGKVNVRLERSEFRKMKQGTTESFNKFLVRIRTQAKRCRYGKEEEEELIHQITSGAVSAKVRDKGVDADLKLDNLVQYAIRQEMLESQKSEGKRKAESYLEEEVNRIERGGPAKRAKVGPCGRCGANDHESNSLNCRARSVECFNCHHQGHLARFCRSKNQKGEGRGGTNKGRRPFFKKPDQSFKWGKPTVQNVSHDEDEWKIEMPKADKKANDE